MTATSHANGDWPTLLVGLPLLALGVGMMWKPGIFAQVQIDLYRRRYGIVAGPVGAGTRLFCFGQGVVVAGIGLFMMLGG